MVCTSKYKRCTCKLCKKKTRLRTKQKSCKSVLDKFNNEIKSLFYQGYMNLQYPLLKYVTNVGLKI